MSKKVNEKRLIILSNDSQIQKTIRHSYDDSPIRSSYKITNGEKVIDDNDTNREIADDDDDIFREVFRVNYADIPSEWDPNYSGKLYLDGDWFYCDNWHRYYGYEICTLNSILLLNNVLKSPIYEYLHNKIVELIPFGIHNIWFYALEDHSNKKEWPKHFNYFTENKRWCYEDFGNGIHINGLNWRDREDNDFLRQNINIDDLMTYVENWAYLSFDVIILNDIWSDEHNSYCKCFQFRGFFSCFNYTLQSQSQYRPSEKDIKSIFPDYYNRKIILSEPFSETQKALRQQFDIRVQEYYSLSNGFVANSFNRSQEKPIMRYIGEYLKYESVRYSYQQNQIHKKPQICNRTYNLSFHMLPDHWNKLIEAKQYNNLSARKKGRVWSPVVEDENRIGLVAFENKKIAVSSIVLNVTIRETLTIGMTNTNHECDKILYLEEEDIPCIEPPPHHFSTIRNGKIYPLYPPYCDRATKQLLNQIRKSSNKLREDYLVRTRQRLNSSINNNDDSKTKMSAKYNINSYKDINDID